MKDNILPRILVIIVCLVIFVAVLIVNALAGAGRGPFHSSTGNVSSRFETDVTPAGWTFSIWGVIYTWLTLMVIYLTSYVFRGSWAQSLLPYAFYFCWVSNLLLNITWLLVWDREMMSVSLVVLLLVVITNVGALFCCCYATDYYGLWLASYHRRDLSCLRILVQNGLALYTTWTSIAALINLALVLHLAGMERSTAATAALCLLLGEVSVWFILENWVLDRWVRNILTVYPVVIVALAGNVYRRFDPEHPTPNAVFTVVLLVLACILFVSRVFTVIWRNKWRPLLSPGSARLMVSPLDTRKFSVFS
ncbi:uncharacterized protein LOC114479504 [Gouania willdenowi]|uniref:uncharacterized protein LOC114458467 n=1 Tax=Gouania willdenowi TaxID=441366 RepID=UPI0010567E50|nr:uncharacterized protein LOC114458467 [Gouania willdenowi]XP_028329013.1 uncharacterized protein LOC114479504 [Gouania willdenowi]